MKGVVSCRPSAERDRVGEGHGKAKHCELSQGYFDRGSDRSKADDQ
jgi:hypothetical protein